MPRKPPKPPERQDPVQLKVDRDEGRTKLDDRIQKGGEIRARPVASMPDLRAMRHEFRKWDDFNVQLLKTLFTTEELSAEYSDWVSGGFVIGADASLGEEIRDFHGDVEAKIQILDSIRERLEIIPLAATAGGATNPAVPAVSRKSNKVFVVHGHDERAKTNLEVMLRDFGLDPIVLHRQADQGFTVIEKFEKYSDVGYAFILLTPDEVAYLQSEAAKPDNERAKELRARPNVIFEFGYFVGKLGRSRVCCLHTGDVTLPSDVSGMIYKKYANSIEEVIFSIMKDLKAAGFELTVG